MTGRAHTIVTPSTEQQHVRAAVFRRQHSGAPERCAFVKHVGGTCGWPTLPPTPAAPRSPARWQRPCVYATSTTCCAHAMNVESDCPAHPSLPQRNRHCNGTGTHS
eukprot:5952971-Prymnesium_polylepis.1